MEVSKKYERLRELYAVLMGIPDERVALDSWRTGNKSERMLLTDCGTTGCAIGWACAYPPFKAQGLKFHTDSWFGWPTYQGRESFDAVSWFFDLEWQGGWRAAVGMFGMSPGYLDYGEGVSKITDRQRALMRIRRFLLQEGAITETRNEELAKLDGAPA